MATISAEVTPNTTTSSPLGALYGNSGLKVLAYPLDLGSASKNHYVKFSIKQIVPTDFAQSMANGTIVGKTEQALLSHSIKSPTTTLSAFIALYMPDTLNASFSADYSTLGLTSGLGSVVEGIQYVQSMMTDGNGKIGTLSSDAAVLTAVAKGLAAMSFGTIADNLATAVGQSNGFAVNPQIQMIFNGVGFRTFQLAFTFTPRSQTEAQMVDTIISTFKYHYAPDVLSANASDNGLFYIPPSYFNLEFMFGSVENRYLPKYGDCVLGGIDVNYAPNGFASHTDGAPVQTQLTLSFTEMEIVTKSKLQAGYDKTSSNSTGTGELR